MAAEVLVEGGARVTVYEGMASLGRKFLLAGRGGLNLTHSEDVAKLLGRYGAAEFGCGRPSRRFRPRPCAPGARRWGRRRSSARAAGCFRNP